MNAIWMDFSGAPPLIVPCSALASWHGFYVEDPDATNLSVTGRSYAIKDDFDFAQPVSDYERPECYRFVRL